jgi:ribonuclease J
MSEAQSVVADTMDQLSDEGVTDWGRIKNEVKSSLSDYVWKQTQRSPMIIPIIMEI